MFKNLRLVFEEDAKGETAPGAELLKCCSGNVPQNSPSRDSLAKSLQDTIPRLFCLSAPDSLFLKCGKRKWSGRRCFGLGNQLALALRSPWHCVKEKKI